MRIRDLAARCARVMLDSFAQRGRGECRVPNAPAASRANGEVKHTSVVTEGSPGSPGIPARNGFNGLFRALPGERIRLVTVISGLRFCQTRSGRLASADLTPATGVRTTRLCRPRPVCTKGLDGPVRQSFSEGENSAVRLRAA